MAEITAAAVKDLRERTGAGFMDCKNALVEAGGDLDKAVGLLRERGLAAAAKKQSRDAREGLVSSYIHTGGRVGVLIEVNCETDFVARTDEFQKLVRDLAVQVAGLAPLYSLTTSTPELAPRGMEFLYSRNRLNVATSRARCVAIVTASPELLRVRARTVRQMRLANAFCRFVELATNPPSRRDTAERTERGASRPLTLGLIAE